MSRTSAAGTGGSNGRNTCAKVPRSSLFVTGFGATILTGPCRSLHTRAWSMALMASCTPIQLIYCWPLPKRRLMPAAELAKRRARAPPLGVSTTPIRSNTVRMPASSAGRAACSHCADIGDKGRAGLVFFNNATILAITVKSNGRGTEQHLWFVSAADKLLCEQACALHPAIYHLLFFFLGPAALADVVGGKVNHPVKGGQACEIEQAFCRIPINFPSAALGLAPHQSPDFVAACT